jgi:hypothetical protein
MITDRVRNASQDSQNFRQPTGIAVKTLPRVERLRDPPTEWIRQFDALGLNPE